MNEILLQEEQEHSKQYKRAMWWVEHRALLQKIGIAFLLLIDTILVLFVVWRFVDAFFITAPKENRALLQSVFLNQEDLRAYSAASSATDLIVSNARSFRSAADSTDFYAQMENTNNQWWAEFEYQFSFGGEETGWQKSTILPQSKKPLMILAHKTSVAGGNVEAEIQNVVWHRVDAHKIADYETWSKNRLSLDISNLLFTQEPIIGDVPLSRTEFTVHNNTAFSYESPSFFLILKRGSSVIGVNKTTLQSLVAGEKQDVIVNWFGVIPSASQFEVIPDLDLFDARTYKILSGEEGIDTRFFAE